MRNFWLSPQLLAAVLLTLLSAAPAGSIETLDGRVELHGFYEMQMRTIADDFRPSDDYDLTQWYHVLNLELELDIAPDGIGPFDLISAFVRTEVRYDCIWRGGCGMFNSVNTYGDDAEHLPGRLAGARRSGLDGSVVTGDTRTIGAVPLDQLGFEFKDEPEGDPRRPAFLWHFPGVSTLFGVEGPDGAIGTTDDPAFYTFERFVQPGREYRFTLRNIPGPENGRDRQSIGPWRPRDRIDPEGTLADRANPFRAGDFNPVTMTPGSNALPFRPAPRTGNSASPTNGDPAQARGLFLPNERYAELLRDDRFDSFDQNFRQEELEWNLGASQQDEPFLKEAYLDIEMFDARLWLRLGKQNIVWGKTELFRTTDQFNPQDLGLATLPDLEASRIGLWSARAVWSFWNLGPFSDVRLEGAVNFDQFEPVDLGRCGEPYAPLPVCNKSVGLFAHGLVGQGLAGEIRPPDPWEDASGLEYGARLEFRWDRFSFAISDFYGFDDFPYLDKIFFYERNVDPITGRPREANARGSCLTGTEPECLEADEALEHHHANQQRFGVICSSSVGFNELDRGVCAFSVLGSSNPFSAFAISQLLGHIMRGGSSDTNTASSKFFFSQLTLLDGALALGPGTPGWSELENPGLIPGDLNGDLDIDTDDLPLVHLFDDDGPGGAGFDDGPMVQADIDDAVARGLIPAANAPNYIFLSGNDDFGLSPVLSDAQEALLGCGPFYGTHCDISGIDLLNAEASALTQSWTGAPGTGLDFPGNRDGGWDTTDPSLDQPGTLPFVNGVRGISVCRRYVGGDSVMLPGCRGPGDEGYSRRRDGTPSNAKGGPILAKDIVRHPFTGQRWRSEMAAFSWNLQMMLVGFSGLGKQPDDRLINDFDPNAPLRRDGCSFAAPQFCSVIQSFYAVLHTTRRTELAGGNGAFGRHDFDWHQGGAAVLRYQKRNVLGFSMDFAEDVTKSNWSMETTWINKIPVTDHGTRSGISFVDTYNLTVSVDRPAFINFLNANRTFFINSQWFFQYTSGYESSMTRNGPWNVLGTLNVSSGYWQDRLTPSITLVYDIKSGSGAGIPQVQYQFSANFSVTVGVAAFWGRWEPVDADLAPVGDLPLRTGRDRDVEFVENGLSAVRDRDEIFFLLRYTF